MFGNNPVVGPRSFEQGFMIKQIWYTIQGEGPYAGRPAIFVRFTGCNLRCFFCDTDFQGGEAYDLAALCEVLWEKMEEHRCTLLVFTGGEPMLQEVFTVAERLAQDWREGFLSAARANLSCPHIQIETAGTVWPEWPRKDVPCYDMYLNDMFGQDGYVTLVCSPKTPRLHPLIAKWCFHWKYIIRYKETSEKDGLPDYATQSLATKKSPLYRADSPGAHAYKNIIYVQPCDEGGDAAAQYMNKANMQEAVHSALRWGYTLSIQTHKIAGVE